MNKAFNPEYLVRENIRNLKPYSSARKEFSGSASIFLDANENSFGSPLNRNYHRYPDPMQMAIKEIIADWNGVKPSNIFIGNGSDEAIDLLFRIFCGPKRDNIVICPPTYGMYEVLADINDIEIRRANLTEDFQLDIDAIKAAIDQSSKLIFICSPNNPTGNSLDRSKILELAREFSGIVVIDEAYIHFSKEGSFIDHLADYPNLVILQTFSKAWGLAGLRVGLAFADEGIIKYFNSVKPPYNLSQIAQEAILEAMKNKGWQEKTILEIISERGILAAQLGKMAFVEKLYPSDANFILAKTSDADGIYKFLLESGIIVRNRNTVELCEGCLRITIGTIEENIKLIEALKEYEKGIIY